MGQPSISTGRPVFCLSCSCLFFVSASGLRNFVRVLSAFLLLLLPRCRTPQWAITSLAIQETFLLLQLKCYPVYFFFPRATCSVYLHHYLPAGRSISLPV